MSWRAGAGAGVRTKKSNSNTSAEVSFGQALFQSLFNAAGDGVPRIGATATHRSLQFLCSFTINWETRFVKASTVSGYRDAGATPVEWLLTGGGGRAR